MGEMRFRRCPTCGRKPKVSIPDTNTIIVECKQWYRRKPHLRKTFYREKDESGAQMLMRAIDSWNGACDCANLPVW